MKIKNALGEALLPTLLIIMLFPLIAKSAYGCFPTRNYASTTSDSSYIDSPTASGEDYKEEEDYDSAFNGIQEQKMSSRKSDKIYTQAGVIVTKTKRGVIYIKDKKKFVSAN